MKRRRARPAPETPWRARKTATRWPPTPHHPRRPPPRWSGPPPPHSRPLAPSRCWTDPLPPKPQTPAPRSQTTSRTSHRRSTARRSPSSGDRRAVRQHANRIAMRQHKWSFQNAPFWGIPARAKKRERRPTQPRQRSTQHARPKPPARVRADSAHFLQQPVTSWMWGVGVKAAAHPVRQAAAHSRRNPAPPAGGPRD